MGSTGYNCLLLLLALLSGTSAQIATRNCSLLREAPPSNAVFALGGGGCVNCTLGFRSARWGIELDGAFSAINAGQEPDECDCIISERRLCFQNVGADIVPNYRCQVQVDVGSDLVECGFQVQLASLPTIDSTLVKTTTVDLEASATLTLRLSEPGLPIPTISWLKDSNPITLDGRYSINSAGSLTIADVMAEDRGAYQVSISNIAGTVTENYMLFVNFAVLDLTYSELANGDGSVQCVGSGWPAPSPQDVSLTGSSTQVRTSPSMYEVSIVATETISNPAANCLPSYICTIAFGMLSLSQTLTPSCGTPPPPILLCPDLTIPANGGITYNPTIIPRAEGTMATYTCDTGYQMTGLTVRMCTVTGWSNGEEPICTALRCPAGTYQEELSTGESACVPCPGNSFSIVEDSVECICFSGYYKTELEGPNVQCSSPPNNCKSLQVVTERTRGNTITVRWERPEITGRNDLYYNIFYSEDNQTFTQDNSRPYVKQDALVDYSVSGLRPLTTYTIRVIPENGVSDQEEGGQNKTCEIVARTGDTRSNSPSLVIGFCIVVVWTTPTRSYGKITGYDVRFIPQGSGSDLVVSKGRREFFHAVRDTGLVTTDNVMVQVRAKTSAAEGRWSELVPLGCRNAGGFAGPIHE